MLLMELGEINEWRSVVCEFCVNGWVLTDL